MKQKFKDAVFYLMLFGLLLLSLASCVTQKACNEKFPPVASVAKTDSSSTKIVYRDQVIKTPGETVYDTITVQIDCDENGKGSIRPFINQQNGNRSNSTTYGAGNKIYNRCQADSLSQVITRLETEKEVYKSRSRVEAKPVIQEKYIEVKHVPLFYKVQNSVALSLEFFLLAVLLIYFLKRRFNIA